MLAKALVSVVVAVLGLVAYLVPGSPKREELGRIAFAMALLVILLITAYSSVKI